MSQRDKTHYYDALGDKFEGYMSDYDVERRQRLIFDDLLGGASLEGVRVLEVGSGTGRFSRTLRALGAELTVLDIGPNLVDAVATELSCRGVVGDALRLPFADAVHDAVVSSECIEHTLQPEQAIREMCRVIRPGGWVCLTTPNKLWYPVMRLSQAVGARKYAGIENWLFPGRAAAVMRAAGMQGIAVSGCHLWPFQLRPTRGLLRRLDAWGNWLYPLMINFGILGRKPA
jgi:ubiquinone/menaquinone biosynthesis C-methylase UbiE